MTKRRFVRAVLAGPAALWGPALLLEAGLVALVAVGLRLPDDFRNLYGYSRETLPFFLSGWGLSRPPALSPQAVSWAWTFLWLGLNLVWLLAVRLAGRARTTLRAVLLPALLFNLTLGLALPPLFSTDSLNYLAYGRMVAFHGQNPYTTLPSAVDDPIRALSFWNIVCPYGPLWVGLSTAAAGLAGYGNPFGGLLLLKGLAGLAHLGLAVLAYHLAKGTDLPGLPPAAVALAVGWSPLFLLEGAGNAHNDLVMLALALGGLWAWRRGQPWAGYLLLVLSALVKYVSLLLVFFFLLAWLRREAGQRRALLLGKAVLLGILVAGLAVLPFGSSPQAVLTALLGETTRIRASPVVFLLQGLERAWSVWPALADRADSLAFLTLQVLLKSLLLALVLAQGTALWRREGTWEDLLSAWERTALAYICFLHGATFPWYFTWPAGSALLGVRSRERRMLAGLAFGLGVSSGLLYGIPF
ncbi:MAG: hypothetical protein ACP5OO_11330 [Chloroflexia bacterium]